MSPDLDAPATPATASSGWGTAIAVVRRLADRSPVLAPAPLGEFPARRIRDRCRPRPSCVACCSSSAQPERASARGGSPSATPTGPAGELERDPAGVVAAGTAFTLDGYGRLG